MKQIRKISFIIPTYNEEDNLPDCLAGISAQQFSHQNIEVIIADGESSDATLRFAEAWGASQDIELKTVPNPRRIAEFGKAEALRVAEGDYIVLLDADNRLVGSDWLTKALNAFDLFPDIFGFESHYLFIPSSGALNNYLNVCLHINDPLAWGAATRPVESAQVESAGTRYHKYHMPPGYPCGANGFIYRRSAIEPYLQSDTFEEAFVPMDIARKSDAFIAMADGVGIHNFYVNSLRDFLRKRAKIALKSHTRQQERDTWLAYAGPRLYLAALLQITYVGPLVYSLWMALRQKNKLWLLHAPVCFVTSVTYLLHWLRIKLRKEKAW